jgi:Domain of unknown function (DUF4340)
VSLRGLLVLLIVLAAACAAVVYFKAPPPPTAPGAGTPFAAPLQEGKVRRIEIACGPTGPTLERAGPAAWRLTAPLSADADPRAIHTLIAAVQDARAHEVVAPDTSGAAAYGLDPAACTLRVAIDGESAPRILRLGRTSPVGVDRYAIDRDGRVVLVDGSLYTAIDRPAETFREKRLVPVAPETVTRIEIERPDGTIAVERTGASWRMSKPVDDDAASSACSQLARAITAMELTEIRSVPVPESTRSGRRLAVRVTAEGKPGPIEAFVAGAGVEGERLAWREGGAFAGLLSESAAAELDRPPDALRDRNVASFSAPDVRGVTVERGASTLRLTRAKEGAPWEARDGDGPAQAADPVRADALVDTLRWLSAAGFEAAPAPTPTAGTVTVTGAAGPIARWSWGPLPTAPGGTESVWVTTPSRPGVVFRIAATSFGPIPAKASELAQKAASPPAKR